MANEEERKEGKKHTHVEGERHEKKTHKFRPLGPGYTPMSRTGQEADYEPPHKGPMSEPGYTPMAQTDIEEDEEAAKAERRRIPVETSGQGDETRTQQGTFVNVKTGEVRTYFANPPRGGDWHLLSPRLDISLEEARRLIKQGGYGSLRPEHVHF